MILSGSGLGCVNVVISTRIFLNASLCMKFICSDFAVWLYPMSSVRGSNISAAFGISFL